MLTTFEAGSIALTSRWVVTGNNSRRCKDWEDEGQESEDGGGASELGALECWWALELGKQGEN